MQVILQTYNVGRTKIYVRAGLDIMKEKMFTIVAHPQTELPCNLPFNGYLYLQSSVVYGLHNK